MSDPNADNPDVSDKRSLAIANARLPGGACPFVILILLVLSAMLSGHVLFGSCQADNGIPVADLDVSTTRPEIDEIVLFNASDSTDDGEVVAYFFDFGDGKNSSWIANSTVAHSYDEKFKEFDARVKIRDDSGQESNWSETVTVNVQEKVTMNADVILVGSFIVMALVTAAALAFLLKTDDSEDEVERKEEEEKYREEMDKKDEAIEERKSEEEERKSEEEERKSEEEEKKSEEEEREEKKPERIEKDEMEKGEVP